MQSHSTPRGVSSVAGDDLVWRIVNPVMAGLIGLRLAGPYGGIAGAVLLVGLPYAPSAIRRMRAATVGRIKPVPVLAAAKRALRYITQRGRT